MKLTIENTDRLVQINGIPARVWEGTTENGIAVQVLVTQVAVHRDDDQAQFLTELAEQRPLEAEISAFPLRMVL